MEDSVCQYLERTDTPRLTEYIDECTDEIIDIFSQSSAIVYYSDVKSMLVTKFKEVMIASGVFVSNIFCLILVLLLYINANFTSELYTR